jgi:hypothetical protein
VALTCSGPAGVSPGQRRAYVPRSANVLRKLLRRHFDGFAALYDRLYACRYGRFCLQRITETVAEFLRCGDYHFGVARLKCCNPSCGCETKSGEDGS